MKNRQTSSDDMEEQRFQSNFQLILISKYKNFQ